MHQVERTPDLYAPLVDWNSESSDLWSSELFIQNIEMHIDHASLNVTLSGCYSSPHAVKSSG